MKGYNVLKVSSPLILSLYLLFQYLRRECDSTPFHYGSHYSNSGIVLHYLIRLQPYTEHFLKYQGKIYHQSII